MKERNLTVDLYRLIFMVLICLWHYNPGHFISSGYLGVEFFFLLSGYLMYSAIKKKTPVMDYLKKRYSQLLGKYLLVLILMHIIKGCIAAYGGTFSFIDALTSLLPECLLLQNIGVFHSTGYLFPTWYLSVLIYGGTFILLLHNNLGSKWGGNFCLNCNRNIYISDSRFWQY